MLSFGTFAFTQPWLLIAALTLPAIWLLLRVTPPAPRRIAFPPFLLLAQLISPERTPARTPWWLLLLRLLIAALLIFALAGPVLNPAPRLGGSGPLLLVVDNGWAAAKHWSQRIDVARELLQQAEREAREVMLLETAPDPDGRVELRPMTGREAQESLAGWQPRPWPVDRAAAREVLGRTPGLEQASSVWLSDGVARGEQDRVEAERLAEALQALGPLQLRQEPTVELPLVLSLGEPTAGGLTAQVTAVPAAADRGGDVAAVGPDGETVARVPIRLPAGEAAASAGIELPPDLRNRITRVELGPPQGIAGTFLLDERWRRRSGGPTNRCSPSSTSSTGRCDRSRRCMRGRCLSCCASLCRCW